MGLYHISGTVQDTDDKGNQRLIRVAASVEIASYHWNDTNLEIDALDAITMRPGYNEPKWHTKPTITEIVRKSSKIDAVQLAGHSGGVLLAFDSEKHIPCEVLLDDETAEELINIIRSRLEQKRASLEHIDVDESELKAPDTFTTTEAAEITGMSAEYIREYMRSKHYWGNKTSNKWNVGRDDMRNLRSRRNKIRKPAQRNE